MGIKFYEDEDAIEAIDRWGEHKWIVGETVEPACEGGVLWIWTVNDQGVFMGVHPNSISIIVRQESNYVDLVSV